MAHPRSTDGYPWGTWSAGVPFLSATGPRAARDGEHLITGAPHAHGAIDVAGGDPVRAGHHPGQALPGDRDRRHRLQPPPCHLPQPDPDEGVLPAPRRDHPSLGDGARLRVEQGQVRRRHRRGHRLGAAQDGARHRDRDVRAGLARQRRPVRQAGLLPRAGAGRRQGLLPAQVGPRRAGEERDLQDRAQGPRAARRPQPVQQDDAADHAALARRGPRPGGAEPARGRDRDQGLREEDGRAARGEHDRRVRPGQLRR